MLLRSWSWILLDKRDIRGHKNKRLINSITCLWQSLFFNLKRSSHLLYLDFILLIIYVTSDGIFVYFDGLRMAPQPNQLGEGHFNNWPREAGVQYCRYFFFSL